MDVTTGLVERVIPSCAGNWIFDVVFPHHLRSLGLVEVCKQNGRWTPIDVVSCGIVGLVPITAHQVFCGVLVASGSKDFHLRIINDISIGAERIVQHDDTVCSVGSNASGSVLATGSRDTHVRIIDRITGIVAHKVCLGAAVFTVAFNREGKLLAAGTRDQTVRVISVATGKVTP